MSTAVLDDVRLDDAPVDGTPVEEDEETTPDTVEAEGGVEGEGEEKQLEAEAEADVDEEDGKKEEGEDA